MAKRYEESFKKNIVKQQQSGIPADKLCSQYGIARSTLFLWKKQYTTDETGQIPRERYLLEKELERLRTENAIFKTCGCAPTSPLSARLFAIREHADVFSIHALCRVLGVNRSTYYHYVFRSPDQTQLQIQDRILKPLIEEIFAKSGGRFGARKIRIKLMEQGHAVSERRILRLMKECGLSSSGSKPRSNSANDRQYQYYPNKLTGTRFATILGLNPWSTPFEIWCEVTRTYQKPFEDTIYTIAGKTIEPKQAEYMKNKNKPDKTVTFVRLADKRPSDGWDGTVGTSTTPAPKAAPAASQAASKPSTKTGMDLAALLG